MEKTPSVPCAALSLQKAWLTAASLLSTTVVLEERISKLKTEQQLKVQEWLLHEVTTGRLKSITTIRDIKDLTLQREQRVVAAHTYIHYGALLTWLRFSGYTKQSLILSQAFENYEDREIALAKEIERLILDRRELEGYSIVELKRFTRREFNWSMDGDDGPNMARASRPVVIENRRLKLQLAQAKSQSTVVLRDEDPRSIGYVLAAVLKVTNHKDTSDGLVKNVLREAQCFGATICENTVRTKLKDAFGKFPPKES